MVADSTPHPAAETRVVAEGDAGVAALQRETRALSHSRRPRSIRVGDRDVEVTEYEYFSSNDPKYIVAQKFVAPDGTETSTYQEMLEKLGGRPRPYLPEDEHRPASTGTLANQNPEKDEIPENELREQSTNAIGSTNAATDATTVNASDATTAKSPKSAKTATTAKENKEDIQNKDDEQNKDDKKNQEVLEIKAQSDPRSSAPVSETQTQALRRRTTIADHPLFPNEFSEEGPVMSRT